MLLLTAPPLPHIPNRQRSFSDTEIEVETRLSHSSRHPKDKKRKSRAKHLHSKIPPHHPKRIVFPPPPSYDHVTSRLLRPTQSFIRQSLIGKSKHDAYLSSDHPVFSVRHITPSSTGEICKTTQPSTPIERLEGEEEHEHFFTHYPVTHASGGDIKRRSHGRFSYGSSRNSVADDNSDARSTTSSTSNLSTDIETASVASLPVNPYYLSPRLRTFRKKRQHVHYNSFLAKQCLSLPFDSDEEDFNHPLTTAHSKMGTPLLQK